LSPFFGAFENCVAGDMTLYYYRSKFFGDKTDEDRALLRCTCSADLHPAVVQGIFFPGELVQNLDLEKFIYRDIYIYILELSLKSPCLHPLFGSAFTPYPLFEWYPKSNEFFKNLSMKC
jgi:hypothetical protein